MEGAFGDRGPWTLHKLDRDDISDSLRGSGGFGSPKRYGMESIYPFAHAAKYQRGTGRHPLGNDNPLASTPQNPEVKRAQRSAFLQVQGEDPLAPGSRYRDARKGFLTSNEGLPLDKRVVTFTPDKAHLRQAGMTPGQIVVGGQLHPSLQGNWEQERAAKVTTLMHEVAERRTKYRDQVPGHSHLSPKVLFDESNLINRLTGPGAEHARKGFKEFRAESGEAADLSRMVNRFSGGRYNYEYGDKMPKAMKKAIVKWLQRGGR